MNLIFLSFNKEKIINTCALGQRTLNFKNRTQFKNILKSIKFEQNYGTLLKNFEITLKFGRSQRT